jgi:invasion protein IalB
VKSIAPRRLSLIAPMYSRWFNRLPNAQHPAQRMCPNQKDFLMSRNLKLTLPLALLGSCLVLSPAFAAKKKPTTPAAPAAESTDAQPSAPAAAAAPAGAPNNRLPLIATQKEWTKVCGKDPSANKQVCYTTRDFSAEAGKPPVLALAVYDVQGEDTRIVRMLMPVGLMLRPGFRFAVDNGTPTDGSFEICFPNGCFAEAKIKGTTLDGMKKGKFVDVSVRNRDNAEVIFGVPLENFGKSFDGPAIDPKVLQEQQQKLQAELQKRAEDERKKLEASKQASPTGGAAAPTASK